MLREHVTAMNKIHLQAYCQNATTSTISKMVGARDMAWYARPLLLVTVPQTGHDHKPSTVDQRDNMGLFLVITSLAPGSVANPVSGE